MAYGIAPLHLSWWGYTGTLGADFVHYVVTDRLSSPPETRSVYAEKSARALDLLSLSSSLIAFSMDAAVVALFF